MKRTNNTVIDVLYDKANQVGNKNIYSYLDNDVNLKNTLNYFELFKKAISIANLLKQNGVKKGDRVLLIYEPGLEFIVAFFGCLCGGFIAVPCYPPANKNTVEKLVNIINNSLPSIILSNKYIVSQIKKLSMLKFAKNSKFINLLTQKFTKKYDELLGWDFDQYKWITTDNIKEEEKLEFDLPKKDDIAFIQYTSGSTHLPKGVIVRHQNLMDNVQLLTKNLSLSQHDKVLSWLPLYHDMGLIGGVLTSFYNEMHAFLYSPLDFLKNPSTWLRSITQYQTTLSVAPNFAYGLCVNKINDKELAKFNLSHLRALLSGAEPINEKTMLDFIDKFSVCGLKSKILYPCYGLAESTLYVTGKFGISSTDHHSINEGKKNIVSCGHVSQNIYIVNPDTKTLCATGEIGEICLRGDSITTGYWNNEQETNDLYITIDNNFSLLKTGDLGFIKDNELFVTGRIKDILIFNGVNYYPQDFEYTTENASEYIRTGCVAAFSLEDDNKERLVILAEIKDHTPTEKLNEIIENIKNDIFETYSMPIYAIALIAPRSIHKTTSGKIKRYANKIAFLNEQFNFAICYKNETAIIPKKSAEKLTNFNKNLRRMMKEEISRIINLNKQIIDDTHFNDFGLDSLSVIELQNKIEDYLEGKYHFQANDIYEYPNIAALSDHIEDAIHKV